MILDRAEFEFILILAATALLCALSYLASWLSLRAQGNRAEFLPVPKHFSFLLISFISAYFAGASVYTNALGIKIPDEPLLTIFWTLCGVSVHLATVMPWMNHLREWSPIHRTAIGQRNP